jgi:AmmeMemoRadiSam system protein A
MLSITSQVDIGLPPAPQQHGDVKMPPTPATLTADQGRALLQLARRTLMAHFGRKPPQGEIDRFDNRLEDDALQTVCGTFVTLELDNRLRGCIGTLEGREPLATGVATQALNAAFHDPRFPPLDADELDRVSIEISVLTPPRPLAYADAEDLLAKLRPGIDGVTISQGFAGATFLPQVWEQLPTAEAFLSHLCLKAGLGSQAWRSGKLKVETYQVQYFEESR